MIKIKIFITAVIGINSKRTNIHWNIMHTAKLDTGETKSFFFDDAAFAKSGYKPEFLSDLSKGQLVPVEANYDDRGNVTTLAEA